MNSPAGLRLESIKRSFAQGKDVLHVLNGADLTIQPGEIVALVGPSGAGKSTLLHIAGLLERPDEGEVWLAGEACGKLGDDRRTALRRSHLGFVYQYHHLLPEFSALENVVLPQMIAGKVKAKAEERGLELLDRLGLKARADHRPGQLSGGEQQRVAICRALANNPKVLLADEPTGNLDPNTAEAVFQELIGLVRSSGVAALIATHNPELALRMDHVVRMQDGRLVPVARGA
ncbi:MAG TPA: ABC transporter ATP-binding protein [Magnetospirillum sp.]|jgi:lipoprotein-releasing system ATP-binding protein|nr:ABC transporter ATP-binding protein [Magnetospirillum sp.]